MARKSLSDNDRKAMGQRLRVARTKRFGEITVREAARLLGENEATYGQYENGTRPISRAAAVKLAPRLRTTVDWLMLGKGDETAPDARDGQEIPILALVSAGTLERGEFADEILGVLRLSDLPDGDWVAFKVEGDSMDRISPPDSVILVNRRDKRLVANACYVIADITGEATYKRYRPNPTRFEPVSTNQKHETLYPDNEPTIIGRVHRSILQL